MSENAPVQAFQVDLRGIVDLLSRHIYSSPHVFLRELLQNGRDAITARRTETGLNGSNDDAPRDGTDAHSPAGTDADSLTAATTSAPAPFAGGTIRITPVSADSSVFRFRDNGIGLTISEVGELLATVGRSSKRDIFDLPRGDYLGQFGIGLLSCFMVADRIQIRSRSVRGGLAIEWLGSTDGTYTARELSQEETDQMPFGTEVILEPFGDSNGLLSTKSIIELATRYGEFLDIPVRVDLPGGTGSGSEHINRDPHFIWHNAMEAPSEELIAYGRELLGAPPFAAIPLLVPGTSTRGTAFVMPYTPSPGTRQANRVYLGGMLLNERVDDLLPDWAFFVRCAIDTTGLAPTASREQLIENESLEFTREQLGEALRRWIVQLATSQPAALAEFIAIHHVALKGLVLGDDELASTLARWLTVETSNGVQSFDELFRQSKHIRFAQTIDEFRQIAGLASADAPIVNAGYLYDADIIRRLPDIFGDVTVEQVSVESELDNLDAPPLEDRGVVDALELRASTILAEVDTRVDVRRFHPEDLPGLYVLDPKALRSIERSQARDIAPGVWGGVLGRLDKSLADAGNAAGASGSSQGSGRARLCLNWNNALVRTLSTLEDETVFSRSIQLIYVQALLAGHRPMRSADRSMLTSAISDLVHLSVGLSESEQSL